jgi:hypothetical protein
VLNDLTVLKTKQINRFPDHDGSSAPAIPPKPNRDFLAIGDRVDEVHGEFVVRAACRHDNVREAFWSLHGLAEALVI